MGCNCGCGSSGTISVSVADIRELFPEFSSATDYPDSTISAMIARASCFISTKNYGSLNGDCRKLAYSLVVAHLLYLWKKASISSAASSNGGFVVSAQIEQVSVQMLAPPNQNQTQYWFNQSPYGQEYLSLLRAKRPLGAVMTLTPNRVFRDNLA